MSHLSARLLLVLLGSVLSLSVGNVLLKLGMARLDGLQPQGLAGWLRALQVTPALPLGGLLMALQFAGMLTLFKWGWEVSVVVPLFGLNYAVTALLGSLWLAEPVGPARWAGIALLTVGVALIARDAGPPSP